VRPIRASLCFLAIASVILIVSSISYDSDGSSPIDSGYCGPNITWTYYDDGRLIIEGEGKMYDYGDGKIMPWSDHYDSIRTIYLKGMFSYNYGFYGMKNLESVVTDYMKDYQWIAIMDYTSFREVILEVGDELQSHIYIQLGTDYICEFDLVDQPSLIDEDVHIFFYKIAKKDIPKEYKSLVGNGSLCFFKINDYEQLPVDVTIIVADRFIPTDHAIVTLLDTGEHLETVIGEYGALSFKLNQSGYILVSVEQMELIPYAIPIAIVIALIGIIGSIFYYFTRIRGGVKHES